MRGSKKISAVVLAAGKGVRMGSTLPKVLHPLWKKPLIFYILDELSSLKDIGERIIVLGYKPEVVKSTLVKTYKGLKFVYQRRLTGSAKAVEVALPRVKFENILVICGDSPLLGREAFRRFITAHLKGDFDCSVLTEEVDEPEGLGRIVRDGEGNLKAILEEVDLGKDGVSIKEINTGIYLFKKTLLKKSLGEIKPHPVKKEYFLPSIISLFIKKGYKLNGFKLKKGLFFSVNTPRDLLKAQEALRRYIIEGFLERGVAILDPATTFIYPGVKIGKNSVIYPFTFIENDVKIGVHCSIGPFSHLRSGTVVEDYSEVGNFSEIVRSRLGKRVKMKHFGYLGDAEVGSYSNIGAGAVTANFDGLNKHKTLIGSRVFIGSDSILVAPLKIGQEAVTGAGSVVTKDVGKFQVVAGVPARILRRKKK